jgi:hypothetical protein
MVTHVEEKLEDRWMVQTHVEGEEEEDPDVDGANTCRGEGTKGSVDGVEKYGGGGGGGGRISDVDGVEICGGEVGGLTDGAYTCGEEAGS